MVYELSLAAEKDIEEILDYSYQEFGADVAFDYYQSLKETFLCYQSNRLSVVRSTLSEKTTVDMNIRNTQSSIKLWEQTFS